MGILNFLNDVVVDAARNTLNDYSNDQNGLNSKSEGLSYDELNEPREDVRQDTQSPSWESNLRLLDRKIDKAKEPVMNHIRTFSDEKLSDEINSAWNKYQNDEKIFSKDKRSYEEKWEDNSYKQHERDYRYFDNLKNEERRRYAERNPDKFPVHREHAGIYKKNDD